MRFLKCKLSALMLVVTALAFTACNNTTSYADLLKDETKSINNFLADQKVIGSVPEDSIFITGEEAPYYRMDEDGYVYMKVIKTGDMKNRPEYNDLVYMRFTRYNLENYKDGKLPEGSGNAENVIDSYTFRYQNNQSANTQTWGQGIQYPLHYLGYGCEVKMVIRSAYGPSKEISQVVPFLYHVRYYKSQI